MAVEGPAVLSAADKEGRGADHSCLPRRDQKRLVTRALFGLFEGAVGKDVVSPAWAQVVPVYGFTEKVRRIVYSTNSIESLTAKLRCAVRARGHFPDDKAATKLLYVVLSRAEKVWTMPLREWAMAKAQFAVMFGERFTRAMA